MLLLVNKNGRTALWFAAANGHVEVLRALLRAGGRERLLFCDGDCARCLSAAAEGGHGHVVRALLDAGGRELLGHGTHEVVKAALSFWPLLLKALQNDVEQV